MNSVTDPFGTAALRAAVLDAWAASPARFREDANAEEHLSVGYGGRVLAELAANAADAARAGGVAGEVVVALSGRELRVANSGAPLTSGGVAALAALRASAKRDDQGVGHFGVGFTAVRSLTDDPSVVSATGGVRFSTVDTHRAVTDLRRAGLDAELDRRHGQVPALRLPWPAPSATGLPDGCVTEVRLPLRDDVDLDALAAGLTVDAAMDLLWALPDLAAVTVPGYRVARAADPTDGVTALRISAASSSRMSLPRRAAAHPDAHGTERLARFRTAEAGGRIPAELLAGRPVEERARNRWRLTWVLPLRDDGRPDPPARSPIGAPTPTDEPIGLPARLVGTLPVDESRSRIAKGPLTDYLVRAAADLYADLVLAVPPADRPVLIPPGGFPLGAVDGALTRAVTDLLEHTAFLLGSAGMLLTPARACLVAGLSGEAADRVAEAMPGLLPWPDSPSQVDRLRGLGVSVQPMAAVTAALAGLDRPPGFWHPVYDAFAGAPLDELADLPVPRRGGGTIIGPRGVLLSPPAGARTPRPARSRVPEGAMAPPGIHRPTVDGVELADRAARLVPGLRLAADGADHPLLRRLGAQVADASAILDAPPLAAEVRRRLDELDHTDPDPRDLVDFADLVLDLLAAGGGADTAMLADVLLTDSDGEPWPAGSLLLPDAPLATLLAPDADLPVVGSRWIAERGRPVLARLGVRADLVVRRYAAPPGDLPDLPGAQQWWEQVGAANGAESFDAIPDLDLIADDAWVAALEMVAAARVTRDALRPMGFGPSYTAWWLHRHAWVGGRPLRDWRTADSSELVGLYDPLPVTLPPDMASDLGVLQTLAQAAAWPADLLAHWADPARTVAAGRVPAATAALVAALSGGADIELPAGVRTLAGGVVDADRAAVLDRPWLAQVLDPAGLVAGGTDPALVADALDLPLASQRDRRRVVTEPPAPLVGLGTVPGAAQCLDLCTAADLAHHQVAVVPDLTVQTDSGEPQRVWWWLDGERVLLDGSADGVGRAVAHLAGRWPDRHRLVAAARDDRVANAEAGLG